MEKKKSRSFGGKVGNKLSEFTDKAEVAFEKKHLKEYLKGSKTFQHGRDIDGRPVTHYVKEIWS